MDHSAGLDVSVKETSVCIVDDTGRIVREVKVASEPEDLLRVLANPIYQFKRIGLEAGPLSQWLFSALAEAGLPVICVETRHMRAVLKAQINKTDRNDARGMAQMMRAVKSRPHHLRHAARIVSVRLVDLRLQHRPHVPRLDTDHRQACFRECTEKPLRQRPSFQSDPFEVVGRVTQYLQESFRFARYLHFPHDPACVIHNADTRLLDRYVQSSKMVHAALLLLMLEACLLYTSPSPRDRTRS